MYTNKMVSTFKDRLADACASFGLSDSEVAKGLDVSKQTLSAWKCGTRSPKRPTIETIARYFNVSVDWLLGFDVPREQEQPAGESDELAEKIADLLMRITPQRRELFLSLSPRNLDLLFGYGERLREEQESSSSDRP